MLFKECVSGFVQLRELPVIIFTRQIYAHFAMSRRKVKGKKHTFALCYRRKLERKRRREMQRLKREIGYVIYIAVLLRGRRAWESFYMHFLHVNTVAFGARVAPENDELAKLGEREFQCKMRKPTEKRTRIP